MHFEGDLVNLEPSHEGVGTGIERIALAGIGHRVGRRLQDIRRVVRAARGIGLTDMQILFKVQVPLAKVALYAGIRLAVVSTIGISTIASAINAGGQDRRRRTRRDYLHWARAQPRGPADYRRGTGRHALAGQRLPVRSCCRTCAAVQEGGTKA